MLLAIDIGNTRIKYAVFENNTIIDTHFFLKQDFKKGIKNILSKYKKISNLIVASVGNIEKDVFLEFEYSLKLHFITHEDRFPFTNLYETPHTLGIDRIVLAAGATMMFPKQNRLIIDAGTCVTYDFVDFNDNYLGGAISPGIRLRYEVLHNYTARLPLLNKKSPQSFIGNSTSEAIHSGVIQGLTNEINGFIDQYSVQYENFIIILTGGDADFLAKRLKNTIFANSNFLLESLNTIYQYKIKND